MVNMNYELLNASAKTQKENLLEIFKNISVNESDINESNFTDFSFAGNVMEDKQLLKEYMSGSIDPTTHEVLLSKVNSVGAKMSNEFKKRKRSARRTPKKLKKILENNSKNIRMFFPRKKSSGIKM
jgi:hypothetical protein